MSAHDLPDSPDLRSRFAAESRVLVAARLRVCCWLAITLVPLFVALDATLYPRLVPTFLAIRATMVLASVAALALLRIDAGLRHATALSLAMFLHTGLSIVLMTAFNGGGASPYYAGVNLVMLAAAVLMPWGPGVSLFCCAALVGGYAVVSLVWAGVADVRIFTGNLFFLASTAAITVVSHVVGTGVRRRELLQRIALEEAGRHREQFLANVGHELRTPLTAIFGFCEMLGDYMPDASDDQRGWLARIQENATALYRLVVQLLDFSNLEAGTLEVAREEVRLDEVAARVTSTLAASSGPECVELAIAPSCPQPTAIGDSARVEEIVTALASNALKFSGGRAVVVRVAAGSVTADAAWDRIVPEPGPDASTRDYMEIAVVDRGAGIARDDMRRLFVAFQQLDGSSTRRHEGTGLGLALSARMAAAMGGHIAVRSTHGTGSTFALLIPVAHAAKGARDDHRGDEALAASAS